MSDENTAPNYEVALQQAREMEAAVEEHANRIVGQVREMATPLARKLGLLAMATAIGKLAEEVDLDIADAFEMAIYAHGEVLSQKAQAAPESVKGGVN